MRPWALPVWWKSGGPPPPSADTKAARICNTRAGDGFRFRGRGVLQITGRDNYRRFGALIGVDIEGEPDLAAEPAIAMALACAYWTSRRINAAADRDDVEAVETILREMNLYGK